MSVKGQVGLQFLMMVSIVFVFFIVFVAGLADRYRDFRNEKERRALQDLVLQVHDEIAIAHNMEDGYVRNFTLPEKVESADYTITMSDNIVSGVSDNAEYSTAVAPAQGALQQGPNTIRKSGGVVCLQC